MTTEATGGPQEICEIVRGEGRHWYERVCRQPATMRYPAMSGGFMHLCAEHGEKHGREVDRFGERWIDGEWRRLEVAK